MKFFAAIGEKAVKLFAAIDACNRWIARRTGLYRLDVARHQRQARQYDELAARVEAQGLADSAARLRATADLYRQAAASLEEEKLWSRRP